MKVKFIPQNIELEIAPNQTVKDLADKNGIFIKSICNGQPSCAECRVRVVDGEHNLLPPGIKELNLIGSGHFIDQRRLSCQLQCFGDVTIDLTEQQAKQNQLGLKKPQGSKKAEQEVTSAVSGNFLEQEKVLGAEATESQNAEKPRRFFKTGGGGNNPQHGKRPQGNQQQGPKQQGHQPQKPRDQGKSHNRFQKR